MTSSFGHTQVQVTQLRLADGGWRAEEQVRPTLRLGEGNDIPDGASIGQDGHQAVDARSDPSVGGRAVLEGFQEVAEALFYLVVGIA